MKLRLLFVAILFIHFNSYCPPPTPPISHGSNNTVGASDTQTAPIGTSTILLIGLSAGYTAIKLYQKKKSTLEDDTPSEE
ncbi:MAG: hypothetical protein H6Q15_796 [Bacteroidetes bacterium]|nr:hypothetical protein [Bacteroidota bacterium]